MNMLAVKANGKFIRDVNTRKVIAYRSRDVAQMEIDIHCGDGHAKRDEFKIVRYPDSPMQA